LASEVHRLRALGRDPIAERRAAKIAASVKASPSAFAAAAQDYIEQQCRDKKRSRTWWKIGLVLGLDYHRDEECSSPTIIKNGLANRWRDRPVSEITDADIFAVVDEAAVAAIPGRRAKNKGRSDAREREMINALSGMFKWFRKRKLIATLPTSGLEREPSGERDRVLTTDELRRLWAALPDSPLGSVVKVMILTGARVGEASGMRWSELGEDTWTIPEERYKTKKKHLVPLSAAVQELIKEAGAQGDLVFTTNGKTPVSGFSKTKTRLDRELKFTKPWRLHDIRRTVATMMGEMGIEPHIVEEVLGHVSYKAGVAGLYNRAEYETRKRAALELWARRVEGIISGQDDKKVLDFGRPAR
jgi:integrase